VLGSGTGALATLALGAYGVLLGVVTVGAHLLADALTPMGIQPFDPVDGRDYSLSVTRAANPIANYALLALGSVAVAGAFLAGGMIT
ncbi:inner membrane protein, partial [Halolamina pelagica]